MTLKINKAIFYICGGVLLSATLNYVAAQSRVQIKSGIYGTSIQRGFSAQDGNFAAYDYDLVIKDDKGRKVIKKVRTKHNGDFTITLPPGRYTVVPLPGRNTNSSPPNIEVGSKNNDWYLKEAKVRVWKGYRTSLFVIFDY